MSFSARVEYLIRKMPEQSLKGTMSGNAQAQADSKEIHGQNELAQLQIDAVGAAIDSALKGLRPRSRRRRAEGASRLPAPTGSQRFRPKRRPRP